MYCMSQEFGEIPMATSATVDATVKAEEFTQFYHKLRLQPIAGCQQTAEKYQALIKSLEQNTKKLLHLQQETVKGMKKIEHLVHQWVNTPDELAELVNQFLIELAELNNQAPAKIRLPEGFSEITNQENDTLVDASEHLENTLIKFSHKNVEMVVLARATEAQFAAVTKARATLAETDYAKFSSEEQKQANVFVNASLKLAQLLNQELLLGE
ncbi:MAG: hypothetical protein ACK5MW_04380 [Enterococcus sp.]